MRKYFPPKADPPNGGKYRANIALGLIFAFFANTFGPFPAAQAQEFILPAPGRMVSLSPAYSPAVLKGIKLDPKNPFRFHFFVDTGDDFRHPERSEGSLKEQSTKLIKYFLASLTIPEKDLWVNLSPYEKDRIIPQSFGQTGMGRDLLAEDYILKQITASLIYPESRLGQEFWAKVYAQAQAKYGTTNIPINTFNKVWIVPDKAVVYENGSTAFVLENHLKVMLEEDYLSLSKHTVAKPQNDVNSLGSQIVREIVIPALTKEVNEGKNFVQLRQVFYSLILATWYKKKIKDSILNKVYSNRKKIQNLSSSNALIGDPGHIYQQYLQAFKKGVYNYIKEEPSPVANKTIPRKYFSGGVNAQEIDVNLAMIGPNQVSTAQISDLAQKSLIDITADAKLTGPMANSVTDRAMFNALNPEHLLSLLSPEQTTFFPDILYRRERSGDLSSIEKRALAIIKNFDMFAVHGNLIFDNQTHKSILITGKPALGKSNIAMRLVKNPRFSLLGEDVLMAYFDQHGTLQAGLSRFPSSPTRRGLEGVNIPYARSEDLKLRFEPVSVVIHLSFDGDIKSYKVDSSRKLNDRFNDDKPGLQIPKDKADRIKQSISGINVLIPNKPYRDYDGLTAGLMGILTVDTAMAAELIDQQVGQLMSDVDFSKYYSVLENLSKFYARKYGKQDDGYYLGAAYEGLEQALEKYRENPDFKGLLITFIKRKIINEVRSEQQNISRYYYGKVKKLREAEKELVNEGVYIPSRAEVFAKSNTDLKLESKLTPIRMIPLYSILAEGEKDRMEDSDLFALSTAHPHHQIEARIDLKKFFGFLERDQPDVLKRLYLDPDQPTQEKVAEEIYVTPGQVSQFVRGSFRKIARIMAWIEKNKGRSIKDTKGKVAGALGISMRLMNKIGRNYGIKWIGIDAWAEKNAGKKVVWNILDVTKRFGVSSTTADEYIYKNKVRISKVPYGLRQRLKVKAAINGGNNSAMSVEDKGGIDLNPAQMNMRIKKEGEDFKFDFNGIEIDAAHVTGVTFTIRQMTPVTDLPLVLGLSPKSR